LIEKVFAIHATARDIYAAIESDLADAQEHEGATHEVLHRNPPHGIDLRVTIGNVPCRLSYTIAEAPEHTEVTARLDPYGFKYAAFRVMTFGLANQGFDAALVQSLANLKASVEGSAQ
jgi:hypothetical protein